MSGPLRGGFFLTHTVLLTLFDFYRTMQRTTRTVLSQGVSLYVYQSAHLSVMIRSNG